MPESLQPQHQIPKPSLLAMKGNLLWIVLGVFFLVGGKVMGQNSVTISSTAQSPTQQNPVPVIFVFDQPVNYFEESDINVVGGYLSNFYVGTPAYGYETNLGRLGEFRIQVKSNPDTGPSRKAVIAFDINNTGRIYSLTLDDGVYAHHSDGTAGVKNRIIPAGDFTDPRDIALDSQGNIYIADSGNDRIRVYGSNGTFIRDIKGGLNSPFGVVIGPEGKVYVADSGNKRVVVYGPGGAVVGVIIGAGAQALDNPVRLAVDEDQNVYVNDISKNRVQIFDSNGNYIGTISNANGDNIKTPGSIVVDENGFIYIADLGNINFEDFLDFQNANPLDLLPLITGTDASVKVFRRDDLGSAPYVIKNQMNIPVDLALKPCGFLAVNNADAYLEDEITILPPSYKLFLEVIFDAKTYRILPNTFSADLTIAEECEVSTIKIPAGVGITAACNPIPAQSSAQFNKVWDPTKPEKISCPTNQNVTLTNGSFALLDYRNQNVFTDNCDQNLDLVQNPPAGTPISQNTTVAITARDDAGNVSDICSFIILVSTPPPSPTFDCAVPSNLIVDLDQNCNFGTINYFQYLTNIQNFTNEPFIIPTENINGNILQVTFRVFDGEGGAFVKECFLSATLRDRIVPNITSCNSSNIEVVLKEGETFDLPSYTNRLVATDNCDTAIEINQNPPAGSNISQTTTVSLTAKDDAGNLSNSCSFQVIVTRENNEPPVFSNCTSNITRNNDQGKCGAVVTYSKPTASDSNGNVEVILKSGPVSGSFFQVGASTLIFEATGSNGVKVECSFDVIIQDKEKPQFNNVCEGVDYTANFEEEDGFSMPNFFPQFGGNDNCDSEVSFVQNPAPGTLISEAGTYPVALTIRDDFGNFNTCSFTVTLTSSNSLDLSCNSQFLLEPNDNCQFSLPDLSEEYIYAPSNATVTQSIPQGAILTEDTNVKITVSDRGETLECTIKVILVDYIDPVISCLPVQNVPFTPAQGYTLPNYISQLTYSDNCEVVSVTQEPLPGTVIRSNQIVNITVTDNFGNTSFCFIDVYLQEEPASIDITCPGTQSRNLDDNCRFVVPNFKDLATATEGATILQSPPVGSLISETQTIRLTATLNGVSDFCEFELILADVTPPQLNCPPDQVENYDPANGFAVPDYTGMAGASDNCGNVEVVQSPAEGNIIFGETEITLTAKDQNGNDSVCSFTLSLTEEEVLEITCIQDQFETLNGNCQFVIPNYTTQASVNFQNAVITQSPGPGITITSETSIILTATLNGQTDICEFKVLVEEDNEDPVAGCIATGVFELNTNGTLTIPADLIEFNSTDNCGIASFSVSPNVFTTANLGENVVTVTVRDAAGNEDTCQTTITIVPNENTGSDFTCVSQSILELDATGNATLQAEDLYTGNPGNRTFSLSKENFNCTNTGSYTVTLTYSGSDGSGSCEINVEVVDRINPVVLTKDISISLNEQGLATINPQMVNNGSYDNCGELTFSLDKNTFSCKDIGENIVTLRGEDSSGNISTLTAMVTVTGNCNGNPGTPVDYIYIYPNPTPGPFTFAVPDGWIIEKAEVFDFRGRYLTTKIFEDRTSYSMDLSGLQSAVYVLILYTNEGEKILRVIIN